MNKSIIKSINLCDLICRKIVSKPLPYTILISIYEILKSNKSEKQNKQIQLSDEMMVLKGSHKHQRYSNGYVTKVKIKRCLRYR